MHTIDVVRSAMLRKIKDSALAEKDLKRLKFQPYTAESITLRAVELGIPYVREPGFLIPYFDAAQKPVNFFRYRYLKEFLPRNGFAALTVPDKKAIKYMQPGGEIPHVYFSPLFDWKDFFKHPPAKAPLIITEGELKAACGTKYGFPVLGLGGVSSFMSTKNGLDLLPELGAIDFKDRVVYIVFDSDAVHKPDVLIASNMLARRLLAREAHVHVQWVPELNKAKTGLDDYIVARGKEAFDKLVNSSEEWSKSRALHEFNDEVIFLRESDTIMELAHRYRWKAATAVSSVYKNKTFTLKETKGKEVVLKTYNTAAEWWKWGGRSELDSITYVPGGPLVIESADTNGAVTRNYNCWQGWGVAEKYVCKGSMENWRKLLDFIFTGHKPEYRKFFEQWLAYPIQYPGTKLFSAVSMWGKPGVGKSLIGYTMKRLYGNNFTKVTERELHGNFNEWAEYRQFALGEEITGGDKRGVADYLKDIITQEELRINPKHIKAYTLPDCTNWFFTSNHPDAFFIEDADRRFFVIEVKNSALERSFYKKYNDWFRSDEGAGALMWYFRNLNLDGFDPMGHAMETESKREMISDGRSDVGSWCAMLRENPDEVLRLPGGEPIQRKLWTSGELYALFDPTGKGRVTQNGLGRELKRAGFRKALEGAPLRTKYGLVKLWVIRNPGPIKNPSMFAKLYEQEMEGKCS